MPPKKKGSKTAGSKTAHVLNLITSAPDTYEEKQPPVTTQDVTPPDPEQSQPVAPLPPQPVTPVESASAEPVPASTVQVEIGQMGSHNSAFPTSPTPQATTVEVALVDDDTLASQIQDALHEQFLAELEAETAVTSPVPAEVVAPSLPEQSPVQPALQTSVPAPEAVQPATVDSGEIPPVPLPQEETAEDFPQDSQTELPQDSQAELPQDLQAELPQDLQAELPEDLQAELDALLPPLSQEETPEPVAQPEDAVPAQPEDALPEPDVAVEPVVTPATFPVINSQPSAPESYAPPSFDQQMHQDISLPDPSLTPTPYAPPMPSVEDMKPLTQTAKPPLPPEEILDLIDHSSFELHNEETNLANQIQDALSSELVSELEDSLSMDQLPLSDPGEEVSMEQLPLPAEILADLSLPEPVLPEADPVLPEAEPVMPESEPVPAEPEDSFFTEVELEESPVTLPDQYPLEAESFQASPVPQDNLSVEELPDLPFEEISQDFQTESEDSLFLAPILPPEADKPDSISLAPSMPLELGNLEQEVIEELPSFQLEETSPTQANGRVSPDNPMAGREEGDPVTYYNLTETLVTEMAPHFLETFGICACEQCLLDVTAHCLSQLPPKYVVRYQGAYDEIYETYKMQYSNAVVSQLGKSCMFINESPRHLLDPQSE